MVDKADSAMNIEETKQEPQENPSARIGGFTLGKLLGKGYNSKVKRGYDKNNKVYAVKIIKHDDPKCDVKINRREVEILQTLKHKNIVNLVAYDETATYTKKNGTTYQAVMIVMELVPNGELFDRLVEKGRFPDKVAKYYFKKLIETLESLHNQKVAHRDLKLENLLLDEEYKLKIADFGFATRNIKKHSTYLGTPQYMCPQLHLKASYEAWEADVFAAGIILFTLKAGQPPFARAHPTANFHYGLIYSNQLNQYWTIFERNKTADGSQFFSNQFRDFIIQMFQFNPAHRMTIKQIKESDWYNSIPDIDDDQILAFFAKPKINEIIEEKSAQQNISKNDSSDKKTYSHDIDVDDLYEQIISKLKIDEGTKRECPAFDSSAPNLERTLAVAVSPKKAYQVLVAAVHHLSLDYSLVYEKYTVKASKKFKNEEKSGGETDEEAGDIEVSLKIEVTQVNEDAAVIEFIKREGPLDKFYEIINSIKAYF